jgi:hypothetical protein
MIIGRVNCGGRLVVPEVMFDTGGMVGEQWHPILSADEGPTGTWRMMDPNGTVYGKIQIRRLHGEIRYRAEVDGELIGWANSLKLAAHRAHLAHLERTTGRKGPPNEPR